MNRFRVRGGDAVLAVVDFQEKLANVMARRDQVAKGISILGNLAELTGIPVVITEQYPKGLGPTIPELTFLTEKNAPLEKVSFSCCGAEGFLDQLRSFHRPQVILTGMETHVCILQTAIDLLEAGFQVFLPWDALCSRSDENHRVALEYLRQAGAMITSVETVVFQILGRAGTQEFKAIQPLLKG